MNFPRRLERLMAERGLSGRALATALGISNATVSGWLKSAKPHALQAQILASYFGMSVADLLADDKPLRSTANLRSVDHDGETVSIPAYLDFQVFKPSEFAEAYPDKVQVLMLGMLKGRDEGGDDSMRILVRSQAAQLPEPVRSRTVVGGRRKAQ